MELAGTMLHTETSHVLHCTWNPVDPNCLATAGTDALTRIWKIVDPTTEDAAHNSSAPCSSRYATLMLDDYPWYTTEICWSPSGTRLAVASYNWDNAEDTRINIWSKEGYICVVIRPSYKPVLIMSWNPSGNLLLGVCSNGKESEIRSWDPITGDGIYARDYPDALEYAVWLDNEDVFLAGNYLLDIYRMSEAEQIAKNIEIRPDKVYWWRLDSITGRIATAASDLTVVVSVIFHPLPSGLHLLTSPSSSSQVYDRDSKHLHTHEGHRDTITALEWQPLNRSLNEGEPRRLATCSMDGTIRIWNGMAPYQCLRVFPFGRSQQPVVAMAFSSDGTLLAGAAVDKVMIWDMKSPSTSPKARWELTNATPRAISYNITNGEHAMPQDPNKPEVKATEQGEEQKKQGENLTPLCFLTWNKNGTKLALTHENQIAIVRVPPLV